MYKVVMSGYNFRCRCILGETFRSIATAKRIGTKRFSDSRYYSEVRIFEANEHDDYCVQDALYVKSSTTKNRWYKNR